tara:strand:+ start:8323 stop:8967 length:645 start_codon:yes stop_codon:yes gene_type:complete
MKIVFLGSGGGGNLKFIHEISKIDDSIEVVGLITDRLCGAMDYAIDNNIYTKKHSFIRSDIENQQLISILKELSADLIITNVHKILSESIVQNFEGKLINLHYSYLPAFGGLIGMKPVDEAVNRGNKFIGVTCHEVNEIVDDGSTIAQGFFILSESENPYQSTFEIGAITLLAGIQIKQKINVSSKSFFGTYIISPGITNYSVAQFKTIFNKLI